MKVLLTGNQGYIGSVLTQRLVQRGYEVVGFDTQFYADCLFGKPTEIKRQIQKDIRLVSHDDLEGIDVVIHLAALSNDPLGAFDPRLTEAVNFQATVRLAQLAKASRVRRFLYASSQSMYGISRAQGELDEEKSPKVPLTAYAKTKWRAECVLKEMGDDDFVVVCLRPSTVFGKSPNMRCDIVFNNLVGSAFTTGRIEIKSDGTPWRPVIHIQDVCQAFLACMEADKARVANRSYNVGIPNGNFTIRDMVIAAKDAVPGSKVIFTNQEVRDSRTYRVSFQKILGTLSDLYKPEWDLSKGGRELVDYFKEIGLTEEMFRGKQCNRLAQLKYLKEQKKIDENLYWRSHEAF